MVHPITDAELVGWDTPRLRAALTGYEKDFGQRDLLESH